MIYAQKDLSRGSRFIFFFFPVSVVTVFFVCSLVSHATKNFSKRKKMYLDQKLQSAVN